MIDQIFHIERKEPRGKRRVKFEMVTENDSSVVEQYYRSTSSANSTRNAYIQQEKHKFEDSICTNRL